MAINPSASYSLTLRAAIKNRPGMLGRLTSAIGEAGGDIRAVDLVELVKDIIVRDFTIYARDEQHGQAIVAAIRRVDGIRIVSVSDRTFLVHLGGKIEIRNKVPLKTRDDLSMAYTPGVARVVPGDPGAIPRRVFALTIKHNTVAVVTDGTAVLGLGDIGPQAALPVMEGKALLFKEFADVDAFPVCLAIRTRTSSCRRSSTSPRCSAGSTSRTSPPRAASRSRSGSRRRSISRCSTTISTARPL